MRKYWQVYFANDGGGGGAGGGGGDGGDAPPAAYRPEGLPDHLFGGNDRETMDKVWGAYKGARDDIAARGTIPKDLNAYNFEFGDKAKGKFTIGDDDKLMPAIKQLAQKSGITDKAYGSFMSGLFDTFVDLGIEPPPTVDPNAIYKELGQGKGTTDAEMITAGTQRLNQAQQFINTFTEKDGFDQAMKDELALLTTSSAGVRVMEALMKTGLKPSANPGGDAANQGVTKEALEARLADPRNNRNDPKYDPAFAEQTKAGFKQAYQG